MHPNEDAIHAYVDGSLGAAERTETVYREARERRRG